MEWNYFVYKGIPTINSNISKQAKANHRNEKYYFMNME